MFPERKSDRYVEEWETVAITALPPGWRNVYRQDDGSPFTIDCPAILLQEHRLTMHFWDVALDDGTFDVRSRDLPENQPYGTRAVFAENDSGCLEPATDASNYLGTISPVEDIAEWRETGEKGNPRP